MLSTLILVLDSWGKIPSGILSGNNYDFGAFSQCFDIMRENIGYGTQYCLANIVIINNIGFHQNLYDIPQNYFNEYYNRMVQSPKPFAEPE